MVSELEGSETVLTGLLVDRSAVFGVVGQIEMLGLELLELRQIPSRRHRLNPTMTAHQTACEPEAESPNRKSSLHANSNRS